jgi:hypothetical protein
MEDVMAEAARVPDRDKEGLTAQQRSFLRYRLTTLDDLEALELSNQRRPDLERWFLEDDFAKKYQDIVPRTGLAQARAHVDSLLPTAIRILESMLLGEEVSKVQERAVKALLDVGGMKRIYLDVQQVQIPAEAVIALDMLRKGVLPPPAMLELAEGFFKDEAAVLVPKALPQGDIIEGEAREI